ncbi:MAG: type II toxin-antitoxin system RelE/ParE family toxin [Burkholderiales bacterium]|nr:type II toxin-antitoxin system RelE/ParE family toxin [Burkholderiales bacterium]
MIRSFRHKGLERHFSKSDRSGINNKQAARILRLLDRLDASAKPEDMNLPGYRFHGLKGDRKGTYAVSVSGNWRITFRFGDGDAFDVNLEDYH